MDRSETPTTHANRFAVPESSFGPWRETVAQDDHQHATALNKLLRRPRFPWFGRQARIDRTVNALLSMHLCLFPFVGEENIRPHDGLRMGWRNSDNTVRVVGNTLWLGPFADQRAYPLTDAQHESFERLGQQWEGCRQDHQAHVAAAIDG